MDEVFDISSEIIVKSKLSNRLGGSFILYRSLDEDLESTVLIKKPSGSDLNSILSIRTKHELNLDAAIDIKYRGNDDIDSEILAIAADFLDSIIEVRPHNQMFGKFELLEAPRVQVKMPPIADSTTRSRPDFQMINYGDARSMLTGKSSEEEFSSFIQFANFEASIPDLKYLESAKLRLYYINFPINSNLELHQPNTIWRELGITHANQPYSVELLKDQYVINTKERYVEFDVLDIALKWQEKSLDNFGFIIKTSDGNSLSFFTRESDHSPLLIIDYITSQVYSIGRSELEAGIFIHGKGHKDITGMITVKSDVGLEWLESSIYVHRKEDPLDEDRDALIAVNRREISSSLIIGIRRYDELESTIAVRNELQTSLSSTISISKPDLTAAITVDPNISLPSVMTVSRKECSQINATITINQRDLGAALEVSDYSREASDIKAEITVVSEREEFLESFLSVSRQDLSANIIARVQDEHDIDSVLEIPYYEDLDGIIRASRPDLSSSITVKHISETDAFIEVKERNYLDSVVDVRNINELDSIIVAKQINETDTEIVISQPDLAGFLSPRVERIEELTASAMIRKRYVTDLDSSIAVRGRGNRNYVYIL
ncbi:DNRLRE domain-containing protein [Paenibacillus bouchesdurhonensis]|uniref:DNRLRE domain-containing protein n=1 Tax=Paenibacillus bouchesdurhonensis TaxID=1870990 RepID=UPI000DA63244|nr:DNRLRE domain-containing protein [Paenibacillus bouchesdurhonensis]